MITTILLSTAILILLYISWNLLRKNERLEAIIEYQQLFMNNIDEAVRFSSEKLKEIDVKGAFKSDDEIGWFFKNVLYIQQVLDEFKLLNYEEIQEKIKDEKNTSQENKKIQTGQTKEGLGSIESIGESGITKETKNYF